MGSTARKSKHPGLDHSKKIRLHMDLASAAKKKDANARLDRCCKKADMKREVELKKERKAREGEACSVWAISMGVSPASEQEGLCGAVLVMCECRATEIADMAAAILRQGATPVLVADMRR